MKAIFSLGCVAVVCLLVSTVQAQAGLNCEVPNVDSAQLLGLLAASPSVQCRSQMLAIVNVQDFVTNADIVFQALAVICEPVCLEYVRMVAQKCVPSYVDTLGLACGKNERDVFCWQTVIQNNGTLLLAQCFPDMFRPPLPPPAAENQTTDEPDTNSTTGVAITPDPAQLSFMCSAVCRNALESFRATHGCCVTNAFNTSAFGLEMFGIANYSLWGACQVETVSGNCSSPFVDATMAPTDSCYVLAAHGVLSLLAVLLAFLVIV